MTVEVFLDTNILLYAASGHADDAEKRAIARAIIRSAKFGISGQVLQEFFVAAVRKVHLSLPPDVAKTWLSGLDHYPCSPIDRELVKLAIVKSSRFKISYWDAAILAAAEALGAPIVYSEDLSHGQSYGPVRVVNPFLAG